jgi:PKD repeat protein
MAIPIATFSSTIQSLTVDFTDNSSNAPTSWAWNFGDQTSSTEQNPQHTYSAAGTYTIELIATNADGASEVYSESITLVVDSFVISQAQVISNEAPAGITIPAPDIEHLLAYWRYMLKDNLDIPDNAIEVDSSWPYLWKILIARLIARDYVLKLYQSHLVNLSGTGDGNDGTIKKVETGPAVVEMFDSSNSIKTLFKLDNNGVSPFDQVFIGLCEVAHKLQVHLDCCTPKTFKPIIPQKVETL